MSTAIQDNLKEEEEIRAELLVSISDSLNHRCFDITHVSSILEQSATYKVFEAPLPSKSVYKEWKLKLETLLHSKDQNARWASLLILSHSLLFPPYSVLLNFAESWTKELLLILKRDEADWVTIEAMIALRRLVRASCQWPDIKRNFVMSHGYTAFSAIISKVGIEFGFAVRQEAFVTVRFLIDMIPAIGRQLDKNVEKQVLNLARTSDPILRKRIAQTLALMPKISRKVDEDDDKPEGLADLNSLFLHLIASFDQVLSRLFKGVVDDHPVNGVGSVGINLVKPEILQNRDKVPVVIQRMKFKKRLEDFDFFTECLTQMLTVSYPSPASIPIQLLLLECQRALSVLPSSVLESAKKMDADRNRVLLSTLPDIHLRVLNIIQLLVARLKKKILPHFSFVLKALRIGLGANQDQPAHVRAKIYETISKIAQVLGAGPSLLLCKWFFPVLLSDLNAFTSVLRPPTIAQRAQKILKRQKTGATTTTPSTSTTIDNELSPHSPTRNLSLQTEALRVMQVLLENGGNLWETEHRLQLDRLVVLMLECLEGSSLWDNVPFCSALWFAHVSSSSATFCSELTIPQKWEDYLEALLDVLQTSLRSPASNTQLFLGIGLNLLGRLYSRSPSATLREKARTSLALLEPCLHPSRAPLHSVFLPKDSTLGDSANGGLVANLLATLAKPFFELNKDEEKEALKIQLEAPREKKKRKLEETEKEEQKPESKSLKETPKESKSLKEKPKGQKKDLPTTENEEKENAKERRKKKWKLEKEKKREEKEKEREMQKEKKKEKEEEKEKLKAKQNEKEKEEVKEKQKETVTAKVIVEVQTKDQVNEDEDEELPQLIMEGPDSSDADSAGED